MPVKGPFLTFKQLQQLWVDAGGDPSQSGIAAAVALAESGGGINSYNGNGGKSMDRGLWQINSVHGSQSTFDAMGNARAAIAISNNGKNWRPWCTAYTDGACGTKGGVFSISGSSPVGRALAKQGVVTNPSPGQGAGGTPGTNSGTDGGVVQAVDPISSGIDNLVTFFKTAFILVFYGSIMLGGALISFFAARFLVNENTTIPFSNLVRPS